MKLINKVIFVILTVAMYGCGSSAPPTDSNAQLPQDIVMETYRLILSGDYAGAQENFSDEYIEEFVTSRNKTFKEYADGPTEGWKPEWLKTKLMGNKYNRDVWRVKIIPDEGKGANNGPGIVHDLHIIDGRWKIVFWGHYPKT